MRRLPIGVFDSGIGGISILETLVKEFPNEDFIYVADTKNCPYGIKSKLEIAGFVTEVTEILLRFGVKAIVIACNTATANSDHLKLDIPIVGMIEPTAIEAANATLNKQVLVLATNATAESHLYKKTLGNLGVASREIGCSEFVPLVESGLMGTKQAETVVRMKLEPYEKEEADTIILGCTHFGFLKQEIEEVMKQRNLVSGALQVAKELRKLLPDNKNQPLVARQMIKLGSTGELADFEKSLRLIKPGFDYQFLNLELNIY